MTNFIFSRPTPTSKKLANNLEVILNEQRHQRHDLAAIIYLLKELRKHQVDLNVEKDTLDYYQGKELDQASKNDPD